MKFKNISLLVAALVPFLFSCNDKSELNKKIDEVNEQCGFMLNSDLKDFPTLWKRRCKTDGTYDNFGFKEKRDGIDVYECGSYNGLTTEFYFHAKKQVGFKTRDPEFGFSIYGRTIGYPSYGYMNNFDDSAFHVLQEKGFDWKEDWNNKTPIVLPNGTTYVWDLFSFENKLHINYTRDVKYTFGASIVELEVFLDM